MVHWRNCLIRHNILQMYLVQETIGTAIASINTFMNMYHRHRYPRSHRDPLLWFRAHGHCVYGPQHQEALREQFRIASERCDSLQSFFLMHSLGGGTGSGLGTYILSLLEDDYPHCYRFTTAIFPSQDDDVITSPYNW